MMELKKLDIVKKYEFRLDTLQPMQKLVAFRLSCSLLLIVYGFASIWWNNLPEAINVHFVFICSALVIQSIALLVSPPKKMHPQTVLFVNLLIDLAFITALLVINGGATNAFVSALIIPVVFAGVFLGIRRLAVIAMVAVACYSALLWFMDPHEMHHHDMQEHFLGMWINFIFTTIVVCIIVGTMATMVQRRERNLAVFREQQLTQENLLALGTASAQVAHQLATPVSTIQMLYEELSEEYPNDSIVTELAEPIAKCKKHIEGFRVQAQNLQTNKRGWVSVNELVNGIKQASQLSFPDQELRLVSKSLPIGRVLTDVSLLPAILNLIQNAANANQAYSKQLIELSIASKDDKLVISIRDFGRGFTEAQLQSLRLKSQPSTQGLGIAVLLSNATIERLGGSLTLSNSKDGGAIAVLSIRYQEHDATTNC
ncbi:sensor histidine kinase [Paraferrimonas haliotis]|uniref:sensor histidine kinase n=1 Tax=Paraferrimonas haliotis TaxID=2013866 RepID=UPI000BA98DCF|nr:ATP-binding protein [Paraferrimonas haliotis]